MITSDAKLNRQTFSTSRALECFSEADITTQTGCGREAWWPGVVAKELIGNSLDACEQSGTPPRIEVDFQGDSLTVADNGPGLPADVLERVLNFGTRTSDKAAYVSPTRGGQTLRATVAKMLTMDPALAWDQALAELLAKAGG